MADGIGWHFSKESLVPLLISLSVRDAHGMFDVSTIHAVLADTGGERILRVLLLQDYNTRVVLLGTSLLGMCGGIVGVFMLLRRRSLIGDVIGHSALPGIALAFILLQVFNAAAGKASLWLAAGAFVAGLLGALCVLLIDRYSRLKPDAALAIVLSVFYGLGTALLTAIQRFPTASAAGLKDYLNGRTATLLADDVWLFAGVAVLLIAVTLLLFKELSLLCFDESYASASGWPVWWLDAVLMGLVVGVTIIGMQTVGLILVVAILMIPAAAARFWADDVRGLTVTAAILGAAAGSLGTLLSALYPRIAAGAVIVLCGSLLFVLSLLFGRRRGLLWKYREQSRLRKRTGRHDLLRAMYERIESLAAGEEISEARLLTESVRFESLVSMRSWSPARVQRLIRDARAEELLVAGPDEALRLTPEGAALARRAVRNHRLWELYLITFADIAPSHVDCDADRIEHILGADLVRELEDRLSHADPRILPPSPHMLPTPGDL